MGLEGVLGFIAFFATSMLLSLGLYLKVDSDPRPYFKKGGDVWTEGIGQALMVGNAPADNRTHTPQRRRPQAAAHAHTPAKTDSGTCAHTATLTLPCSQSYVLFWTLFYDIVHIY